MKNIFKTMIIICVAAILVFVACACSGGSAGDDVTGDTEATSQVADFYKLTDERKTLSIDLEYQSETGLFWTYEVTDEDILNLTSFDINPGDENGEGAMWSTTFSAPSEKGGSVKLSLYQVAKLEDVENSEPVYVMDIDVTVDGKITVKSITQ